MQTGKKTVSIFLLAVLSFFLMQTDFTAEARKAADTQPPTAPLSLSATAQQTSATLTWTASTDSKAVSSYHIYRNSAYIGSTTGTSCTSTGLTAGTAYTFFVKAKDSSGNSSAASNTVSITTTAAAPAPTISSKLVVGYYASWSAYNGYTPLNIPAGKLTHVNYAFAKIGDDLKIAMGDSYIDPTNFAKLNELKKTYPQLKTLISIGGWEDSGKFSDAALTDASRTVFADSVVAFLKQYGFNGVDLDWEYPVSGGLSTNVRRAEDKTNFTLLLQKLREKLDAQGKLDGSTYLLSIAGGADTSYVRNTELSKIGAVVDFATIMTYDIHGSWDYYTDFCAPLYTPTGSSPQYQWSVDAAVKAWTASGFPGSKLIMGVPFYGYLYHSVSGGNNGLYQTFFGASSITYDNIVSNYLSAPGYTKYVHNDAKVPWLFNGSTFISYDDEQSIALKASYITQNQLGGAAIWELSQNKGGQLVNALTSHLG